MGLLKQEDTLYNMPVLLLHTQACYVFGDCAGPLDAFVTTSLNTIFDSGACLHRVSCMCYAMHSSGKPMNDDNVLVQEGSAILAPRVTSMFSQLAATWQTLTFA